MEVISTFTTKKTIRFATLMLMTLLLLPTSKLLAAKTDKNIKIGFVTFLSGSGARSFGIPAHKSAKLAIEAINSGSLPAPYNSKGLNGRKIEAVFIDENSKHKAADYKSLIQEHKVDLVIGYISSGSCETIAPVAEQMKKLTIFFDCGTPKIFEDIVKKPKYLFRTGSHAAMDNIAAARYLVDTRKDIVSYTGINQNYSWGKDSWSNFRESMKRLVPSSKRVDQHFPEIYAGQYSSEISKILKKTPHVIHSSFWGGDLEAFLIQASARDLFLKSTVMLTTGESAMHRLASQLPENTIIGAKGTHGVFAPNNKLNKWFVLNYFNQFGEIPAYPSYKMLNAILALKSAYSKTKQRSPDQEAVAKALKGLNFETPSGTIKMAISNGHQGIHDMAYGTYRFDSKTGMPSLHNIRKYKASCISPPAGVKSRDWIKSGFKGAKCTPTDLN